MTNKNRYDIIALSNQRENIKLTNTHEQACGLPRRNTYDLYDEIWGFLDRGSECDFDDEDFSKENCINFLTKVRDKLGGCIMMNTIDIKAKLKELIDRYEEQREEASNLMSTYIDYGDDADKTYWIDFGTYNTLDCVLTALRKLYKEI